MENVSENRKLSAQEVLTQFRRREILDAASAVAAEEGFPRMTMERVAERAGVAKGTLYTYFKDKSELITVMVRELMEVITEQVRKIVASPGTCSERLYRVTDVLNGFGEVNKDLLLYIHQPNDVSTYFHCPQESQGTEVFRKLLNLVAGIVREGMEKGDIREGDPEVMSLIFLNTIHNLLLAHAYFPEMVGRMDARHLVELYLNGIRTRENI